MVAFEIDVLLVHRPKSHMMCYSHTDPDPTQRVFEIDVLLAHRPKPHMGGF